MGIDRTQLKTVVTEVWDYEAKHSTLGNLKSFKEWVGVDYPDGISEALFYTCHDEMPDHSPLSCMAAFSTEARAVRSPADHTIIDFLYPETLAIRDGI